MQIRIITGALLLFWFQVFLVLSGALVFTKYFNPLLLLIDGIAIGWLYLHVQSRAHFTTNHPATTWEKVAAVIVILISVTFAGILFRQACWRMPDPGSVSDVNPQLETLFARFRRGEQPYYQVGAKGPFPVYMPFHWLPIGIARLLAIDTRWTGFLLLIPAIFIHGWMNRRSPSSALMVLLPISVLSAYILWDERDLTLTLELIIAAYYLLLAAGLDRNNYWWTTIGIISCLLSRYTLVFWLPMLAVLLWRHAPQKLSLRIWGAVVASLLIFYVFPFLLREPSILKDGIIYHNNAAIYDWHGYGDPPATWTHEDGVSFGALLKDWLPGDDAQQVTYVRIIQMVTMLALMIGGIYGYPKMSKRIPVPQYSLAMLLFFMVAFYLFSPLTYKYYWISPLMLSGVMCAGIIGKSFYVGRRSG